MNKNESKKIITKENFSTVFKMFDRLETIPHSEDWCWSIDLIDSSNLS